MTRFDLVVRLMQSDCELTPDQVNRSIDSVFGLLQKRLQVENVVTVFGPVQHLQLRSTHPTGTTEVNAVASLIPAAPPGGLLS